jgi:hypothetical protein
VNWWNLIRRLPQAYRSYLLWPWWYKYTWTVRNKARWYLLEIAQREAEIEALYTDIGGES